MFAYYPYFKASYKPLYKFDYEGKFMKYNDSFLKEYSPHVCSVLMFSSFHWPNGPNLHDVIKPITFIAPSWNTFSCVLLRLTHTLLAKRN